MGTTQVLTLTPLNGGSLASVLRPSLDGVFARGDGSWTLRPTWDLLETRFELPSSGMLAKHHRITVGPSGAHIRARGSLRINDVHCSEATLTNGDRIAFDGVTAEVRLQEVSPFAMRPIWRGRVLLRHLGDRLLCARPHDGNLVIEECVAGATTHVPHVIARDIDNDVTTTEVTIGLRLSSRHAFAALYAVATPEQQCALVVNVVRQAAELLRRDPVGGFCLGYDGHVRALQFVADLAPALRAHAALGLFARLWPRGVALQPQDGGGVNNVVIAETARALRWLDVTPSAELAHRAICQSEGAMQPLLEWLDAVADRLPAIAPGEPQQWMRGATLLSAPALDSLVQLAPMASAEDALASAFGDVQLEPTAMLPAEVSLVNATRLLHGQATEIPGPAGDTPLPSTTYCRITTTSAYHAPSRVAVPDPMHDVIVRTPRAVERLHLLIPTRGRVVMPDLISAKAIVLDGGNWSAIELPALEAVGAITLRSNVPLTTTIRIAPNAIRCDITRPGLRYAQYAIGFRAKGSPDVDWTTGRALFTFAFAAADDIVALAHAARTLDMRMLQHQTGASIVVTDVPPTGPCMLPEWLRPLVAPRVGRDDIVVTKVDRIRDDMSLTTWIAAMPLSALDVN